MGMRAVELRLSVPSCAVAIVGAAFNGVGEDGMGGYDEAVPFEAGGLGYDSVWFRRLYSIASAIAGSIRVVFFYEFVEALF